ncbi:alpha/beta hydrolase [Cyanobium sp. NIES-981]|uniref:alpha/beta hydrolase n=1 Tax=Cyanobium sp. NIES-981 TaxID=1851505 RepID=UPI0007DDE0C4|nr:alpha/beta hydrolase [Cyanobium sp. NIES-981]SBO44708.1 conserved protein of unknown function [Cyanobium sp. NIES-981]
MKPKRLLVATNRNPDENCPLCFGDSFNPKGPAELRFLYADYSPDTGEWSVSPIEEPEVLSVENLPSKHLFQELLRAVSEGGLGRNWVISVHGYSADFKESLEGAWELQTRYMDANIILFSWPADPGGSIGSVIDPINSFKKAERAAQLSALAFHELLERVYAFFVRPTVVKFTHLNGTPSLSIHLHSLGCSMLKWLPFDGSSLYSNLFLSNIIIHQAAVPRRNHNEWIDRLGCAEKIYVTLNRFDSVLRSSYNVVNPEALGSSSTGLIAARPVYIDFSGGRLVGTSHNILLGVTGNKIIELLCRRILRGEDGLHGLDGRFDLGGPNGFCFDTVRNCWEMKCS